MFTRTFNYIYKHLLMMLCLLAVVSCTDDLVTEQPGIDNPLNQDKGIGELVLFAAGSTSNTNTRAVIPYMEQDGRFVCKMFYHAKATDTDASPFDTISTPITSWLRVNNNEGNSVYWNRQFNDVNNDGVVDGNDLTDDDRNDANYKDYGFDPHAQFFYWRNRLDHVFLGFCDYNQLKRNTYGTQQGKLFMYPEADGAKKTKTGEDVEWNTSSYRKLVFGMVTKPNPAYSETDKTNWEASHDSTEPYPVPATIEELALKKVDQSTTAPFVGYYAYPLTATNNTLNISAEQKISTKNKILTLVEEAEFMTNEEKEKLKEDLLRTRVSGEENTAEGTFRHDVWRVNFDPEATDIYVADNSSLNLLSSSVAVYCTREKKKIVDIIATAPANTFDLRRGTQMQRMADQPDPLIALTKMKPMGATQEANRVRLYFKHQFSQIQVNLTKGENTAEIKDENIVSVELLGVTEKGYVFTNINPNGTQIAPSYDPVVISKYNEAHLKANPYGTSFSMFRMTATEKPLTSITSFNAIAFGQLQAIRITWKEEDYEEDGVTKEGVNHVATYKISVDDRGNSLVNLKSGFRYMYDFELRRGTIAFIRATIDDWLLDDALDYRTDGTIINE